MNGERLLLDTVFVQALLNRRDQYHAQAQAFLPRVRTAAEVWVTEAVVITPSRQRAELGARINQIQVQNMTSPLSHYLLRTAEYFPSSVLPDRLLADSVGLRPNPRLAEVGDSRDYVELNEGILATPSQVG